VPGMSYKKRGLIGFGYDHSGHGESAHASKYALVVTEQIGNYTCFIYAKTWPPGTDETFVKNDIRSLWRYFRPDYAMGDAFGIGLITQLNHELYGEGLIDTNPLAVGDGQSTQTNWSAWSFAPVRFEGMTKHVMAQCLRGLFNHRRAVLPYVDDDRPEDPATADLLALVRQLSNIKAEETTKSYSSYKMVNAKFGDDLFDAAMASVWALASQGAAPTETTIETITRSRNDLLGSAAMQANLYVYMLALHRRAQFMRGH